MTTLEVLALIQALSAASPAFIAVFNQIRANSGGNIRPLSDIFASTDANLDDVIAKAKKELGL